MLMYVVVILLLMFLSVFFLVLLCHQNLLVVSMKLVKSDFFFDLEFMFTLWNFMFLVMVLIITISVMFFSFSYMSLYSIQNFILLYLSFVFSMLWLIVSNNFYWMMLGWDGSGVVSFLLIVYYMNFESVTNGLFTIFQNRIGDLFFVLFLLTLVSTTMALTMVLKIGVLFLILGACVKSAQYPFNAWLLAAMSAPTPISSLVHSSTLVVAGVYILLQFSYCLCEYLNILKYLSLLTLMISMFGLLNEADMKKLIAYSTMSHVGLMLFMLSLELYKVVYFHLNVHAMFKSLMFMCFGFTMLHSYHAQDKRLVTYMSLSPIIKMIYYFACFCLMGLPFLSGFFSKDFIIEKAMEISVEMSNIVLLMMFLGVSIYYSFKLLYLYSPMFVLTFNETQIVGMMGVGGMMIVTIIMINVYITLVFSVTLELMMMKMVIYMFILCFLLLTLLTNLNFKWSFYTKMFNMQELWKINYYYLDQFMYWTMMMAMSNVKILSQIKYVLVMNWWVMALVIVLF